MYTYVIVLFHNAVLYRVELCLFCTGTCLSQASTLRINKPPLRNKKQTANTYKRHIHQIKTTYERSALPMTNTYPYKTNRTLRDTKLRYKTEQ